MSAETLFFTLRLLINIIQFDAKESTVKPTNYVETRIA